MSDWQVGDLAVCVDNSPESLGCELPMSIGQTSRVMRISETGCLGFPETIGLRCETWCADRFRKIRPDEQEACEPEFVTLLRKSKQRVSA